MLRNMGQICGMLLETYEQESAMYEDIRAFGAPSECAQDVGNSFILNRIELAELVEKTTGYAPEEFLDEIEKRVSGGWLMRYGHFCEAFALLIQKREQAEFDRQRTKRYNQSMLPGVRRQYW